MKAVEQTKRTKQSGLINTLLQKYWHTDCKFCRRTRFILLWFILMLIANYSLF